MGDEGRRREGGKKVGEGKGCRRASQEGKEVRKQPRRAAVASTPSQHEGPLTLGRTRNLSQLEQRDRQIHERGRECTGSSIKKVACGCVYGQGGEGRGRRFDRPKRRLEEAREEPSFALGHGVLAKLRQRQEGGHDLLVGKKSSQ